MKHTFYVYGGNKIENDNSIITTGSTNDTASFIFDLSFDAPIKQAYFRNDLTSEDTPVIVQLDNNNECIIPWNKVNMIGTLYIGIQGLSTDENEMYPTIYTSIEIIQGANGAGTDTPVLPEKIIVNIKGDTGPQGPQGPKGDTGEQGEQGPKGDTGIGIPAGGTTGQVLTKAGADDYNTQWSDASSGGGVTDYFKSMIYSLFNGNTPNLVTDSVFTSAINSWPGNTTIYEMYEDDYMIAGLRNTGYNTSHYFETEVIACSKCASSWGRIPSFIHYYISNADDYSYGYNGCCIIDAKALGVDNNSYLAYINGKYVITDGFTNVNSIKKYFGFTLPDFVPSDVWNLFIKEV